MEAPETSHGFKETTSPGSTLQKDDDFLAGAAREARDVGCRHGLDDPTVAGIVIQRLFQSGEVEWPSKNLSFSVNKFVVLRRPLFVMWRRGRGGDECRLRFLVRMVV